MSQKPSDMALVILSRITYNYELIYKYITPIYFSYMTHMEIELCISYHHRPPS